MCSWLTDYLGHPEEMLAEGEQMVTVTITTFGRIGSSDECPRCSSSAVFVSRPCLFLLTFCLDPAHITTLEAMLYVVMHEWLEMESGKVFMKLHTGSILGRTVGTMFPIATGTHNTQRMHA